MEYTVKPVYNGHPWDPQKVAVVQSWPVFTGFSIKIGIKKAWPDLGWPLLTGGRYSEVAVNTGLTVDQLYISSLHILYENFSLLRLCSNF
jgi:hypothetical protein